CAGASSVPVFDVASLRGARLDNSSAYTRYISRSGRDTDTRLTKWVDSMTRVWTSVEWIRDFGLSTTLFRQWRQDDSASVIAWTWRAVRLRTDDPRASLDRHVRHSKPGPRDGNREAVRVDQ